VRKTLAGITVTSIYGMGVAPLAEKDETTGLYSDYLQIGGKNYEKMTSSSVLFFHTDALGSVVALSNTSGVVTDTYEDDPFGKLLAQGGTAVNAYQFVGGYGVRDIGLSRSIMGMRLYEAEVGRFTSEDPVGFDAGNNFYVYVSNNPLNHNDPQGLKISVQPGVLEQNFERVKKTAFGGKIVSDLESKPNEINVVHEKLPGSILGRTFQVTGKGKCADFKVSIDWPKALENNFDVGMLEAHEFGHVFYEIHNNVAQDTAGPGSPEEIFATTVGAIVGQQLAALQ